MAFPRFRKSDSIYVRAFLMAISPLLVSILLAASIFRARDLLIFDVTAIVSLILLISIGAIGTYFVAAYFLRDMMRPLHLVARSMRRMKLNETVLVQEISTGEMGDLEKGFNAMARELLSMNEKLQLEVEQKTADLQETLEALEIRNADLDLARKRAINANRMKSDFLANMSHEIRTPMNGIIGFTDALDNTELNLQQKEYVETINRSAESLLKIIADILDYSNLESEKLVLHHQPFSLREAIESAVQLHAPQAQSKNIELISLVYSDVPDAVVGDETRVIQILGNLLSNAVKFTSIGDVVLRVMLENEEEDKVQIGLTVADTGIGIPMDIQAGLFDAFNQGDLTTKRVFGGTGLGLSMCNILTKAMGGSISISSMNGEGSTFSVSIQLELDIEQTQFEISKPTGLRTLLLEPHHLSRIVLRNTLEDLGLSVDEHEVMHLPMYIESNSYPLAVLATGSSKNELDSTERVLSELREKGIGSIVLVNSSDQSVLDRFRQVGALSCINKPVRNHVFADAIRNALSLNKQKERIAPSKKKETFVDLDKEPLKGLLCLAVDDNQINLQLLCYMIENMGGSYVIAKNGIEAVEQCHDYEIDIIFLDIHMPIMNGLDAAREIRKITSPRYIPIIALTADAAIQNKREIERAGIDRYLIKPIIEFDLHSEVNALLHGIKSINEKQVRVVELESSTMLHRDKIHALRVAGGSESIANKLYSALCFELPEALSEIHQSYVNKNWTEMWHLVHKLQGAAAVCGVPTLHHSLDQLQSAIKLEDNLLIAQHLSSTQKEAEYLIADNLSVLKNDN